MNEPLQKFLTPRLQSWLHFVLAHAAAVAASCVTLTLCLLVYIFFALGINSDNLSLVSDDLESRRNHAAFAALFPNLEEALLVVVDGESPALAREATDALAARLAEQTEVFHHVYVPGGGRFFEEHAMLYRSPEDLDDLGDQLAALQPVLAGLEADPSLVRLAELVDAALEEGEAQGIGSTQWTGLIDEIGEATIQVYEEHPVRISWESVMLEGSDLEIPSKRLIIVEPDLDYDKILVAARAMNAIEETAAELGFSAATGVRVRVTGNPALNHEEMLGLAWDIGGAGVFCFLLVAAILQQAFRSWRLVVGSLATLLVGLVWTGAFAAATIGELNLISIAFAILFIGLGVDFAIHLGMSFASERREGGLPVEAALRRAIDSIGSSLVLCGFTTATGFLVFWPTEYRGVAELGAIAGAGMFIILFLTLTLLPALLGSWLRIPDSQPLPKPARVDEGIALWLAGWPRVIGSVALVAGIAAVPLLFQLRFDAHVIEMRDPDTDSVQAFRELLSDSQMSPWYINVMTPDLASAEAVVRQLEALPSVGKAVSLASYIPEEQEEKLAILEDLAFLFEKPPSAASGPPEYTLPERIEALRKLHQVVSTREPPSDPKIAESLAALEKRLAVFLSRIDQEPDPSRAVDEFRAILLERLPPEVERLRRALSVSAIQLSDLPAELTRRMQAPDGTARIQVFPDEELQDFETMKRFVDEVVAVSPEAAGIAINLVEFGEVTARSFRQALASAAAVICAMLFILWRRPKDVLLVLAPLVLGSLLTCASMVLLDMPFNFANVLVLPLLFGIGVDSGIHLVHRARHGGGDPSAGALVESATAGAVFFSAMTTTLSFGTLALSGHQGMHTLGVMLTIGMFWTVIANLVVLPALIQVSGAAVSDDEEAAGFEGPDVSEV